MKSLNDEERKEALGSVLAGELRVILEYVQDIPAMKNDLEIVKNDIKELKADVRIVKAAVTDLSHQVNDHERRLLRLETA